MDIYRDEFFKNLDQFNKYRLWTTYSEDTINNLTPPQQLVHKEGDQKIFYSCLKCGIFRNIEKYETSMSCWFCDSCSEEWHKFCFEIMIKESISLFQKIFRKRYMYIEFFFRKISDIDLFVGKMVFRVIILTLRTMRKIFLEIFLIHFSQASH